MVFGENAYERDRQVASIVGKDTVRLDGATIDVNQINQVLFGVSMFDDLGATGANIITNMSENKDAWEYLGEILDEDLSQKAELILIEPKPDKRTKTFKKLKKFAKLIECKPLGERDHAKAAAWLNELAKSSQINLARQAAAEIVSRLGTEQYQLKNELERLAVMGDISLDLVKAHTPPAPKDTAFDLLNLAIKGDAGKLQTALKNAQITSDPYMILGLIVAQVYGLAGLVYAGGASSSEVASQLKLHPFMLRNLQRSAKLLNQASLHQIVERIKQADDQLKTTSTDPWLVVQTLLISICQLMAPGRVG